MMIEPTNLANYVTPAIFMAHAIRATSSLDIEALPGQLPIAPQDEYIYDDENPHMGWQTGKFHWMPVGRERGNAGRIKQANQPVNPIAERAINGMEALIEMSRQRELLMNPSAVAPSSPREAVERYFQLPPLEQLPKLDSSNSSKHVRAAARELAKQLRVRLVFDKATRNLRLRSKTTESGRHPYQFIERCSL